MLRVQHTVEISVNKRSFKELIAALEWSNNDHVLVEILSWAEKYSTEMTVKVPTLYFE